ncbi:VacJ family lipoprotein [Pseudodesulfovibrio sp. zrk46]|uniref:MlaA family lipoprotein n=1 Tax=Pseudodesulfovibrio sp. zrk46 TaxID=2725288 RepID=UPI00144A0867|nr:VacJ family lipoprotein [Pseudodesulfovibrio sp. zrk46]QJB55141.1 VacJ family lipoprotein [Pseudodesulfovibrio sp. zrk46]
MRMLKPLLLVLMLSMLWACGAKTIKLEDPALSLKSVGFKAPVKRYPDASKVSDIDFLEIYDPWEPMNRNLYSFNAGFDQYFMLPVTGAYETVLPSPVRFGVNNFIENANEVPRLVNCMLQGNGEKSGITFSRFAINTIFGVFGLFDVASLQESLPRQDEDFGQTLGVWGVGNGPYFVMPVLGPSNVRDTVGFGGDFLLLLLQMKYTYKLLGIKDTKTLAYTALAIRALNRRSHTDFRYHETGSPFEYELVRFLYTKKRELDIKH